MYIMKLDYENKVSRRILIRFHFWWETCKDVYPEYQTKLMAIIYREQKSFSYMLE